MQERSSSGKDQRLMLDRASRVQNFTTNRNIDDIAYGTDRKGDPGNVRYGSLEQSQIPKYRLAGHGRLIGLDHRFRILSNLGSSLRIEDESLDSGRKHVRSSLLNSKLEGDGKLWKYDANTSHRAEFDHDRDFIALETPNDQERRNLAVPARITEGLHDSSHNSAHSRSGSASPENDFDVDVGLLDQEQTAFEQFKNNPANKRQMELTRSVEEDSQNVSNWFALIAHQENFLLNSLQRKSGILSASEKRTLTETRISLYERALTKVTGAESKERLFIEMMKEGSKAWDSDKQARQWNLVLTQSDSIALRYRYLDFKQTNAVTYSYDESLRAYETLFARVRGMEAGRDQDYHLTYLSLRLTILMHQAGHTERALAMWQALLDYNLRVPCSTESVEDLAAFSSFWDNESLRIGEQGSLGWLSSHQPRNSSRTDDPLPQIDKANIFESWGVIESSRSHSDIMPARTLDDTNEDDPFRVILYSDIEQFMFRVHTKQGQDMLLQAFLKFGDLPPLNPHDEEVLQWWTDPYLSPTFNAVGNSPDYSSSSFPYYCVVTTSALFSIPEVWSTSLSHAQGVQPSLLGFVTSVLTQLLDANPADDRLAEYVVAFKMQQDVSQARKYTKSLLKLRSNSMRLYNAYALVETMNSKTDVANNVWSTALKMAPSFGEQAQQESLVLWHHWIVHLLSQKDDEFALQILLRSLPLGYYDSQAQRIEEGYSELHVINTRRYLNDKITTGLNSNNDQVIVYSTSLLAVLEYLLHDSSLDELLRVYESTLVSLRDTIRRRVCEEVHQTKAQFLDLHAKRTPTGYRPAQIAAALKHSQNLLPENSLIHNLHDRYSRKAGLIDRLRSADRDTTSSRPTTPTRTNKTNSTRPNIASSIIAITTESSRPLYAGSTPHSIRSSFESATSVENAGHTSPLIWSTWLRWELSLLADHTFEPASLPTGAGKKVKEIYFAALRACPWNKELCLIGFTDPILRHSIGDRGLEDVYRSMLERGMRIRVNIEDLLDDLREERENAGL